MDPQGDALGALQRELAPAQSVHPALSRCIAALPARLDAVQSAPQPELLARQLAQDLALALQATLLLQSAPPSVFSAFYASRLNGLAGMSGVFGTLAAHTDFDAILTRALPAS